MTVPSRLESATLLLSLEPPAWHLRHSRAVAEVAAWVARRAAGAGTRLDRRRVESAALLHDVDKLAAVRPLVSDLPHGEGSAAWLTRLGFEELALPVRSHPVTRLADGAWFDQWFASADAETLIVAYADKRAGQRLESLDERFGSWRRRYPPESGRGSAWSLATLDAVRRRADALEARVCALAATSPRDVRRLRWTATALAAASKREHAPAAAAQQHARPLG